ncbi:MAG: substrate-binding domain-containing protein [Phycisphaerae bacterium]
MKTTINVFTAKACAAPLLEAAKLYEANEGVAIHVDMCSRHCASTNAEEAVGPGGDDFLQEIADAGIYDCAIAGAEYLLDDGEVRGIIAKGVRRFIALRRSALLVTQANPKGIARLEDMGRPGVRVAVSVLDCLKGVWEDICARGGLLEAVRKNITFYANGCISIIEAVAQGKVDAAFGWSAFSHLDKRIAVIPLPDALNVSRATSIGMLKLAKNPRPAEAFMDFLTTPEARGIYRRFGWV